MVCGGTVFFLSSSLLWFTLWGLLLQLFFIPGTNPGTACLSMKAVFCLAISKNHLLKKTYCSYSCNKGLNIYTPVPIPTPTAKAIWVNLLENMSKKDVFFFCPRQSKWRGVTCLAVTVSKKIETNYANPPRVNDIIYNHQSRPFLTFLHFKVISKNGRI